MRAASAFAMLALGAAPVLAFEQQLAQAAERHRVPADLVRAVVAVESAGDPRAMSPRGAMGLMQLMPATAARFGVVDPFDPGQSLDGGCAYLRWLLDRFDGSVALALAAYNAGEAAVDRYAGIPPFEETRAYVSSVLARLGRSTIVTGAVAPSSLVSLAPAGTSTSIVVGGTR